MNIMENIIFIYTDAGRLTRPLYNVTNNELNIEKIKKQDITSFDEILFSNLKVLKTNMEEPISGVKKSKNTIIYCYK